MTTAPAPPPPQPCKAGYWFLTAMLAGVFVAITWAMIAQTQRWGWAQPHVIVLPLLQAAIAWGWFDIRRQHRIRLTEDGIWTERRGDKVFTPWQGAELWRRGYIVFVRNGANEARFNLAVFCSQRSIHEFLARKYP